MLPQVSETQPPPDVYLDRGFHSVCIILKIKGLMGRCQSVCQHQHGPMGLTRNNKVKTSQRRLEFTNPGRLNALLRTFIPELQSCFLAPYPGSRVLIEKLVVAELVRKYPPFMEPKVSLPCSQLSATGLCPEPDESESLEI